MKHLNHIRAWLQKKILCFKDNHSFFISTILLFFIYLIGSACAFTNIKCDKIDYISNAATINNRNNQTSECFWQITPKKDYYNNWLHWQLDETIFSISNFYTSRGYENHNYSFMINYSTTKENYVILENNEIVYISLLTSPSKSGFNSYGFSFESETTHDYKNNFYISKDLSTLLNYKIGEPINIGLSGKETSVAFSDNIKSISNKTIDSIAGNYYVVIPYKYAFNIKEYTGHSSFVLSFKKDYLENYSYSRLVNYSIEGIKRGGNYFAFFHDSVDTLANSYSYPDSSFQRMIDDFSDNPSPILAIVGIILWLGAAIGICVILIKQKRKINFRWCCLNSFISFSAFLILSKIMYYISNESIIYCSFWSFTSCVVLFVLSLIMLAIMYMLLLIKKRISKTIVDDNCFYNCNI